MSEEEKAMYKSDDYENQMFAAPVIRTRPGPDGKPITYSARAEHGVKITVKSRADQEPQAATQADVAMSEEQKTD